MAATRTAYIASDQCIAFVQAQALEFMPASMTDGMGPPFRVTTPSDFSLIPEAKPDRTLKLSPGIAALVEYLRGLQARDQERHRFMNVATMLKARATEAATPGEPRAAAVVVMLDAVVAASRPFDDRGWLGNITTLVARHGRGIEATARHGAQDVALATIRQELASMSKCDEQLAQQERQVKSIEAAQATATQLDAKSIATLFDRIAPFCEWRMPEGVNNADKDFYLAISERGMFDVFDIQKPAVDVGSLHDDVLELRKLLADPERAVSPVDVRRLGYVLLAIAARM